MSEARCNGARPDALVPVVTHTETPTGFHPSLALRATLSWDIRTTLDYRMTSA
jgi:hypothetical protein